MDLDKGEWKIAFWGVILIILIVVLFMGSSNNWFMSDEVSVDTQWKEQNTEFAKSGKPCEIMYLRSTNMRSTKEGVAVDAYSRNSLRPSLELPYEKLHLMKNLAEDSYIEVCYKDEEVDTVKPYHGIKGK